MPLESKIETKPCKKQAESTKENDERLAETIRIFIRQRREGQNGSGVRNSKYRS